MYKEGIHGHCKYRVDENGDCYTQNGKFEWVHRNWRYNKDGYVVVSACGIKPDGNKTFRSLNVHVLVAKQFADGWFDGAEVNHKDFNRANPSWWNLEWVTHQENVRYSHRAGKYVGRFGADNPNYGNDTLHKRYMSDKQFAKEKQSRPGGKNGRAKKCVLVNCVGTEACFDCQRDAVYFLMINGLIPFSFNKESVIKYLKRPDGYKGYKLRF